MINLSSVETGGERPRRITQLVIPTEKLNPESTFRFPEVVDEQIWTEILADLDEYRDQFDDESYLLYASQVHLISKATGLPFTHELLPWDKVKPKVHRIFYQANDRHAAALDMLDLFAALRELYGDKVNKIDTLISDLVSRQNSDLIYKTQLDLEGESMVELVTQATNFCRAFPGLLSGSDRRIYSETEQELISLSQNPHLMDRIDFLTNFKILRPHLVTMPSDLKTAFYEALERMPASEPWIRYVEILNEYCILMADDITFWQDTDEKGMQLVFNDKQTPAESNMTKLPPVPPRKTYL